MEIAQELRFSKNVRLFNAPARIEQALCIKRGRTIMRRIDHCNCGGN